MKLGVGFAQWPFPSSAFSAKYVTRLGDISADPRKVHMNWMHHWLLHSERWRRTIQDRIPWVLDRVDLGEDALEIGPGPGVTTDQLRTRASRLTVLELDAKLADSLRGRLHDSHIEILNGDATAMPFGDARFSAVASFTMLHHVPSQELQNKVLREAFRVLQPGGAFVGSDSLQGLLMRLIHIGDTLVPVAPNTFGGRLETAGFQVMRIDANRDAFRFWAVKPA